MRQWQGKRVDSSCRKSGFEEEERGQSLEMGMTFREI